MNEATIGLLAGVLGWLGAGTMAWFGAGQSGPLVRPAAAAWLVVACLGMALDGLLVLFMGERLEEAWLGVYVLFQVGTAAALAEFVRLGDRPEEAARWPAWVVPATALSVAATLPSLDGRAQMVVGAVLAGGAWGGAAWRVWRTRRRGGARVEQTAVTALTVGLVAAVAVPGLGFQPGRSELAAGAATVPWLLAVSLGVLVWGAVRVRREWVLGVGGALLLLALAGPVVVNTLLGVAERRADAEMKTAIGEAAARIDPTLVVEPGEAMKLADVLRGTLVAPPALDRPTLAWVRRADLWTTDEDGRRRQLAQVGEAVAVAEPGERALTEGERLGLPGRVAFRVAGGDGAWIWHAPVPYTGLDGVWLAWEIPAEAWTQQSTALRGAGLGVTVMLALLVAVGCGIAWRQGLEQERTVALERSEAASRAKTEFLAFLGHELRTPLQVILGRAELLQAGGGGGNAEAVGAEVTLHGRVMLRLVGDLLDLGTIEAGKLELRPGPVQLRRLLEAAGAAARVAAQARGLEVRLTVADELPAWVQTDEARMLQVLGNLLTNAVRYTAVGEVELEVAVDEERPVPEAVWVRFTVRDAGIGLPPDKIALLFTLFTRLDSGSEFSREGTGIGLALVQRLVTLMGGTVRADNRRDGRTGAEFVVELLLPRMEEPPSVAGLPGSGRAGVGSRRKVLVAEDNAAIAALFSDHLQQLGAEVTVAEAGPVALAQVKTGNFDVVLLDINLPGLNGVEVARQVVAWRGATLRPRLIGCSAEVLPATRAAAVAAGMEEVLAKPVELYALRRVVWPEAGARETESIFTALRGTSVSAGIMALARHEWRESCARLEEAVARRDAGAVESWAHRMRATARLLEDSEGEAAVVAVAAAAGGDWVQAKQRARAIGGRGKQP